MSSKTGQVTVSCTADLHQALAAGYTPDQIVMASNDAAAAAARAEGVTEGQATATDTAVTAERARIGRLQSLATAGFDKELQAAIDGGMSPEAFALTLVEAAAERGVTIAGMRGDAPRAAGHGGAPKDGQPGVDIKPISQRDIFASRRQASGHAQAAH